MAKRRRKKQVVSAPASEPPIRPGIIGLSRSVPADIIKPPYAKTGDPGPSVSSLIRTPDELTAMRKAGAIAADGIPDNRELLDGDIINIDVTVYIDGVHGDNSCTFLVGDVDQHSRHLVAETYVSMMEGIKTVRNGSKVHDIGRAIERHARTQNLGVVREFIGHGVGTEFHSDHSRWRATEARQPKCMHQSLRPSRVDHHWSSSHW